jgi:hypothetical protein
MDWAWFGKLVFLDYQVWVATGNVKDYGQKQCRRIKAVVFNIMSI